MLVSIFSGLEESGSDGPENKSTDMGHVCNAAAFVGTLPLVHSCISSPRSDSALRTSSAENGTSRHSNSGSMAMARANPTFRWPVMFHLAYPARNAPPDPA